MLKNIVVILLISISLAQTGYSQDEVQKIKTFSEQCSKGDYAILEVRMVNEDEFRTVEGNTSSIARIALFNGKNKGEEVLSKSFDGFNSIINILNELTDNKWEVNNVYSINGSSLLITHYLLQKKK